VYIRRALEDTVASISRSFPVLLVTGPRQAGKTTLLTHLAGGDRRYVTLDDPDIRLTAKNDPALFLQRYPPPLIIDEIQYAPELLPYIKIMADRSRERGAFWLTGSQAFHTMKNVSESLAGRVGIVNMLGLSASEIAGVPSEAFTVDGQRLLSRVDKIPKMELREVYERIFKGSMPALYGDDPPRRQDFYRSYIATYLQRDIREQTQVADETAFHNFLIVTAARTAKPVRYEELAGEVGISSPTAKKWMSILVSSGVAALVQPYHNNALKRVVKAPLLHFLDTGLCAHLLGWDSAETLERGAASGAFFESYVFSEIYKSYLNAGLEPPVYYYRDRDQKEIDLLIYQNGVLHPVEIKKSASPGAQSVKHFKVLDPLSAPECPGEPGQGKIDIGTGAVVCMAADLLPIDRKNWHVPVWMI
jgi:predicted AAA+ superfamily ATPase